LEKIKDPSLDTLQNVYLYLESLIEEIGEIVSKVLINEKEKAREVVENIIEAE
jgi:hypothetical protein